MDRSNRCAPRGSVQKMRSLFLVLLAGAVALVQAVSSSGSRLLVVTDDAAADKQTYSKFLGDVESRHTLKGPIGGFLHHPFPHEQGVFDLTVWPRNRSRI